ncbi:DNA (cytosine-5)-methyltransferase DRM2 isoform X2 [Capsella rubella]|uniref:DNA (cytosine-5)-methyltransferase DRM2 isoform X2 n=1 Tax=Capsella rubella TaxID=81985 RepID=UPI000CD5580C|nr:DNA (cytosine-5)-methyltransferase DRM2 isoform X2 [Capsella rubella]XP_023637365.1 DNA (cytosine-5)-methyltransferase DRM2 isoform X2 [Capsella rubella]XP_023637366.1 DNA (cytosine-5)-methyltransferase DRM2 isoform X2 [Capsella rubella]
MDSAGDDDYVDWNTDDDFEIDNFQSSPVHSRAETLVGVAVTTSSLSSPIETTDLVQMGFSDEIFATLFDMGFPVEMIARAIKEAGPNADTSVIIDTISKYSSENEAGSSKSKTIDHFLAMGFDEEKVINAIHEHGEENMDQIANTLLSCAEPKKLTEVKEEDDIDWSDDEINYSETLLSDDEKEPNSSNLNRNQIRSLVKMGFSELEASLAVERCGENVDIAELTDFLCAAQMAREFTEFHTEPEEQRPRHDVKKRRLESKREPSSSVDDEPVRLPNPMIGFGLPNEPREETRILPELARGPPFFYYENVALAPKGVWETISRHLYEIPPEFVDSKYFCAAARKRGYIHNLPISNRFQLQPPPKYTINEAFPLTKKWWPDWDKRTKLNCILTVTGSAQLTNRIRSALEPYSGEPEPPKNVQRFVIDQCRRWNLVWVGKNKAAPLEPDEMENLLGFPRNHTRGGGMSRTERYKSLGNSFQVDTVAYHLSVLKPIFPDGINVLSLFTGIGGGEVALHRLQIRMKLVVSVEISKVNRNILKDFWEQTNQTGVLIEFSDVQTLTNDTIEDLMKKYGGFDLVIGGSPCNNLAGGNRVSRVGLGGDQSSLFFEYCRILEVVRGRMRRY